jgi:arsenite methyltransferase
MCRGILLYVEDMGKALQEIHRVLKPRGRVAIIETDWSSTIANSLDQVMTHKIFDAWGLAVANPNLPRRLGPVLERIGFGALRVEAIPVLNAGYSEHSFSANMLHNFATIAVKQNVITSAESRTWRDGIDSLIQRNEYFLCVNRVCFLH